MEQSLAIWKEAGDPLTLNAVRSLDNLGELYYEQGRYEEAEVVLQQELAICEQYLGSLTVGIELSVGIERILGNLALLYKTQRKYLQAESLLRRQLELAEQNLEGQDTPSLTSLPASPMGDSPSTSPQDRIRSLQVAGLLDELAILCLIQEKFQEAEQLYLRALHIQEGILSPEDPKIANVLHNLAVIYCDQEKYTEAEALIQRALQIWEQSAKDEYDSIIYALNNLAVLFSYQGKYSEAEPLYQRVLHIWEQNQRLDPSILQKTVRGYVALLRATEREKDAQQLEVRFNLSNL